jgi:hypothetical protein
MTVLNMHKLPGKAVPAGAIYIGRGSRWGNPFVIGKHGDRDDVCDQYEVKLQQQVITGEISVQDLAALHDKDLVCFCAPHRCHGDTLSEAALWAFKQLQPHPLAKSPLISQVGQELNMPVINVPLASRFLGDTDGFPTLKE